MCNWDTGEGKFFLGPAQDRARLVGDFTPLCIERKEGGKEGGREGRKEGIRAGSKWVESHHGKQVGLGFCGLL